MAREPNKSGPPWGFIAMIEQKVWVCCHHDIARVNGCQWYILRLKLVKLRLAIWWVKQTQIKAGEPAMTVNVLVFSKGCMGLLYSKECNMNDHLIAPPSMGIKCHISLVLNQPELAIFRRNASNIHTSHFQHAACPNLQRLSNGIILVTCNHPISRFSSAIHVLIGRLSNSISSFRKNMHLKKTLMCFHSHIWNYISHTNQPFM